MTESKQYKAGFWAGLDPTRNELRPAARRTEEYDQGYRDGLASKREQEDAAGAYGPASFADWPV